MTDRIFFPHKLTALLVYGRPPLIFGGMLCALAVMWTRSPQLYAAGVLLLLVSMTFDLVDGWFAARFQPHPTLANLADRLMDKVVYSIIFPLVAVGSMWRLCVGGPGYGRAEVLHAILVLLLCITVLLRDNFAHFMRSFATQKGGELETNELTRLRTIVAAPVAVLLYAHAFYIELPSAGSFSRMLDALAHLPLRILFMIEIVFLIINFGSIAAFSRKYGTVCLDELCLGDEQLRRRILSFFPNALTVMNAMMGLLAVFFAYQGRVREAYLLLIGAAIFDKLDGALARRLGLTEPPSTGVEGHRFTVGGLLDDIADAVSFCIVPALIFYLTLAGSDDPMLAGLPVTAVAVGYAALGMLRLIYFTLDRTPIPGFFKGMPTPAAALLVVAPLVMFNQAAGGIAMWSRFWGICAFTLMVVAALAMNLYPVHYLHIGRFMDRNPWFGRITALVLLVSMLTPYLGYLALFYLLLYLVSPLWTWRLEPPRG